jgi:hypothetical protein
MEITDMNLWMKYEFQTLQKENYWLPPAFAALFLIVVAILGPEHELSVGRAFLGYVLPLLSGGLSAYAFLSDPAVELQFATRQSAARMMIKRLGVIFGIVVVIGILYQLGLSALGVSLTSWGGLWQRQLVWLIPCFTTLSLGAMVALLVRNATGGFAFVGGLWIFQLTARAQLASSPIFRNILLFYAAMDPFGEPRKANQIILLGISLVSLAITHHLLIKQERYL